MLAAAEARKMGHGGTHYISTLFGCDPKTIRRGLNELSNEEAMKQEGVRAPGGGPKCKLESIDGIDDVFLEVLRLNTAGDPMKEHVKWTNLSRAQIIDGMKKKGITVSKNIVKQLLKKHHFVKRKMQKTISTGVHKDRNEQFLNIADLREQYELAGEPIISIDTKKKNI